MSLAPSASYDIEAFTLTYSGASDRLDDAVMSTSIYTEVGLLSKIEEKKNRTIK